MDNRELEKTQTSNNKTIIIIIMVCVVLLLGKCMGNSSPGTKEAWYCAQEVVKQELKSPSSARFCSYTEANICNLGNNEFEVTGYVDAENSFGVKIRSNFRVTLTLTSDSCKDVRCSIY